MPGKKDAAWWRDYRARKAAEQQQSKGLRDAGATPATPRLDTTGGHAVDRVDTSTSAADLMFVVDTHGSRDRADWTPRQVQRPGFLAAPDDDCAACGHDRQAYHLDGICRMPTGPRSRCGCPAFVDSAEPF